MKDTVNRSPNIIFSFYSTNNIAKEKKVEKITNLGIDLLPREPILQLLNNKNWDETNNLVEICKKVILSEYEEQYKGKNNNYLIIEGFSNQDWEIFFNQIVWSFGMPNEKDLGVEIKKQFPNMERLKI